MPRRFNKILWLITGMLLLALPLRSQSAGLSFFEPADTLHRGRFWTCAAGGFVTYSGFSIGLYHAWYKEYELGGFRTFNDWGEWESMDKIGHAMTAYTESVLAFKGALWTGLPRRTSMWTGAAIGWGLQATVEMMDAFSVKWGFSWSDIGFNTLGVGLFVGQELAWEEQRILLKISTHQTRYPETPITAADGGPAMPLAQRARDLYGASFAERALKDYNAQTYWLSVNPASFLPQKERSSRFPAWLNIALGYGVGNVYGGYANRWTEEDGTAYHLSPVDFPRYHQFYLSPDIDFTRIPTRSPFLRTVFSVINWIKVPAPALEVNTQGRVKFHAFYW